MGAIQSISVLTRNLLQQCMLMVNAPSACWALVHAAVEGEGLDDLQVVAKTAKEQYHTYLHTVIEALEAEGARRVAA